MAQTSKDLKAPPPPADLDKKQHRTCACCCRSGYDLKRCTACKSVWYCDVTCQKDHRKAHKKKCKEIANDLKEGTLLISDIEAMQSDTPDLWNPPPTKECPICNHALPHRGFMGGHCEVYCCGKDICMACKYFHESFTVETNAEREIKGLPELDLTCAFCRAPKGCKKEGIKYLECRIAKNDPDAMMQMARCYHNGECGLEVNKDASVDLIRRASALGSSEALGRVAYLYLSGIGCEPNEAKAKELMEEAAAYGCLMSRINLGVHAYKSGNPELAAKHWRIGAAHGDEFFRDKLEMLFKDGVVSETEHNASKRAFQKAREEMATEARMKYAAILRSRGHDSVIGYNTF